MAIILPSANTVISDDRELLNVTGSNVQTRGSMNYAIRAQNHTLKIYSSTGAVTKTYYWAVTPSIKTIV